MYAEATQSFPDSDVAILCAAVADYRPAEQALEKIKRNGNEMTLNLVPNKDIAASLGKVKKNNQILIGFALETNNEEENALKKMEKKNLDFIVLNSLKDSGAGFQHNTNKISILERNGNRKNFDLKSKTEVAEDIIHETLFTKLENNSE